MSAKSKEQLENERITAETQGSYAESIQKEGTKQKLIEAITAQKVAVLQPKGISPTVVLIFLVLAMMGVTFFIDKKNAQA